MEKMFKLSRQERNNLLKCFKNLFGKESVDYFVVKKMDDTQLCEYWSLNFD